MSVCRKVVLKGLYRSLESCVGSRMFFTLGSSLHRADRYHSLCKPKIGQPNPCTQSAYRRESSVCEVSKALKQPSGQQDFYRLLGIDEETFDLDQQEIERKYKKLQTVYHPDKYANASEAEKALSEEASSLLNIAYSTLKSPLDRAIYLLGRKGIGADEEKEGIDDPAFLMEVMEAREEIEDLDNPEALQSLKSQYLAKQGAIIQDMSTAFANGQLKAANEAKIRLRLQCTTMYNKIASIGEPVDGIRVYL